MKLTKLLNLVSPDRREPQLCEACHQPFTCGFGLTGCWCAQVKLSETTRRRLGAQYRRCLCRACLEKAEAGGKEGWRVCGVCHLTAAIPGLAIRRLSTPRATRAIQASGSPAALWSTAFTQTHLIPDNSLQPSAISQALRLRADGWLL